MQPHELRELASGEALRERIAWMLTERGQGFLADAPTVNYVRYKPGTGCLFGLAMATTDGVEHHGYLKTFENDDADICFEKYRNREREGGWVALVPEASAVYFHFPLDRAVKSLWYISRMDRLKHAIHETVEGLSSDSVRVRGRKSRLTIVKYKPERRCIVKADLNTRDADGVEGHLALIAQAFADGSGERVFERMQWLRQASRASRNLHLPQPLGYDAERRILYQEWVPGRSLGELLTDPRAPEFVGSAARAARELHELAVTSGESPTVDDLLAQAGSLCRDLWVYGGELAPGPDATLEALRSAAVNITPVEPVVLHGDFHYHQLLIDDRRTTLIDWDEVTEGDALSDVGNFLAHLHLRELQAHLSAPHAAQLRERFAEEYFGRSARPERLSFYVAFHLLRLAHVPFRNLDPNWEAATEAILARMMKLLSNTIEVAP